MTPLAYAIAKQATLAARKRKGLVFLPDKKERGDHLAFVSDIHCFECTEVFDLACELSDSGRLNEVLDDRIFLPAPRTWIEHKLNGRRHGWLLTENPFVFRMILDSGHAFGVDQINLRAPEQHDTLGLVLAMLALINAPRIIGREEFQPHRNLTRLWARRPSKVPLHAWHELKLIVAKPADIDDGEPHAEHIGGRRALHFCRAHLRIRPGRLEFVTSHWRGDPALGTKLTRYRVAAN